MKRKTRNWLTLFICSFASLLQSCQPRQEQHIISQFQHILDSTYTANPEAVGILVHVEAPDKGISWSGVTGKANKKSEELLTADAPLLIASNTKTYVAAAIMKLIEKGNFTLDDSIQHLIQTSTAHLLSKDGYTTEQITVRHLLSHTSGIADYVDDAYFEFINEHPEHDWTRDEQIARAMTVADPLAKPGTQFSYADMNYLLLTEIIERQTGTPFYTDIRELLEFKKHGLKNTWFINLEEPLGKIEPLAHQYWEQNNWDSHDLNPSWDLYGGGGLVATAKDMALFFQLLFTGKMISDPELLAQLHGFVLPAEESNYCLGLRNIQFHGTTGYYHGGFWGTDALYFPEFNASFSACTLQKDARGLNEQLHADMLNILLNERLKGVFPVRRLDKDSTVKVTRSELQFLLQKGIQTVIAKTPEQLSRQEHILLLMLLNTGSFYLPENDIELNEAYQHFYEQLNTMDYPRKVGTLLDWHPNPGMGMYFPDLDLDYGGAKIFGWGFFELKE